MSRTEIAVDDLTLNAGTVLTKTDLTGGVTGANAYYISGLKKSQDLRIVAGCVGATGILTLKSGDYCMNGIGDLEVTLGGGSIAHAIIVDGARFRQDDATMNLDCHGVTGTIQAFQ